MTRYVLLEREGERPWVIRDVHDDRDVFTFGADDRRLAEGILDVLNAEQVAA